MPARNAAKASFVTRRRPPSPQRARARRRSARDRPASRRPRARTRRRRSRRARTPASLQRPLDRERDRAHGALEPGALPVRPARAPAAEHAAVRAQHDGVGLGRAPVDPDHADLHEPGAYAGASRVPAPRDRPSGTPCECHLAHSRRRLVRSFDLRDPWVGVERRGRLPARPSGTRCECHLALPRALRRRRGSSSGAYPAGVTATEASPHVAAGEAVLWRERRSPPFMEAAIAAAVMLAVAGVAVGARAGRRRCCWRLRPAPCCSDGASSPATTSRISC